MSGSRNAVVTSAKAPVCNAALASSPVSQPTNSIDCNCCRSTPSIILRTTFEPSTTMMRGVAASESRKPVVLIAGRNSQFSRTSLPQMVAAGEPRPEPAEGSRRQQQQAGQHRPGPLQHEAAVITAGEGREARLQRQRRQRQQAERRRAGRQPVPGPEINERPPDETVGGAELLQHLDLLAAA